MSDYLEAKKGDAMVPYKQGIYDISATQGPALGTRIAFSDGRVFRYALAGATELAPGKLVVGVTASEVNTLVYAAAAIGDSSLVLETTTAATTAADDFLQINDVTGEGIQYKIKYAAANATTSTYTDLDLYDPIATALTITTEASIIPNPYKKVVILTTVTECVVGVPPVTVTEEYYFWLQTWGLCPVLQDGTPAVGSQLMPVAASGGVTLQTGYTNNTVGTQYGTIGVDGEYKPVFLRITP